MDATATSLSTPFKVLLQEPELVTPLQPTPSQDYFLSNMDLSFPIIMHTIYLFAACPAKACEDPVKTLKEALKKVLVLYYPLAGRLNGRSPKGKLNVHCNDEGVVYVEAEADTSLSSIPQCTTPDQPWLAKLVLSHVLGEAGNVFEMPLVAVQVTKFQCGGFALGLSMNHLLLDGTGATYFLNSWAEIARGVPLSILPHHDRSSLKARIPLQISYPHNEFLQLEEGFLPSEDIVFKVFCFSEDHLKRLKAVVMQDGELLRCTTFEALAGLVWQLRTKVMGMVAEQTIKLLSPVDWRNRMEPPMPKGFIGNAVYQAHTFITVEELTQKPLSHVVKQVQEALSLINNDYIRSAIDYLEVGVVNPTLAATLIIANWTKLALHTTDFGWGQPIYSGPVLLKDKELVLFLPHNLDRKSINVLIGLPPNAMEAFDHLIQPHLL